MSLLADADALEDPARLHRLVRSFNHDLNSIVTFLAHRHGRNRIGYLLAEETAPALDKILE